MWHCCVRCMQQVTTVGYGDIVPTTDAERVYVVTWPAVVASGSTTHSEACVCVCACVPYRRFVIVCTFIGNGIFAFMVGRVTALASQMNASHQLFVEKMDSVVRPAVCETHCMSHVTTWWVADRMSSCTTVGCLTICGSGSEPSTTPSGIEGSTSTKMPSLAT